MVEVELKDLEYYLDYMARKQLPYGCAGALTAVSAKIGADIAKISAHKFHTTGTFARSHKIARLGMPANSVKGSSFVTLPANKEHGGNMRAILVNQHWGMSEQMNTTTSKRLPNKSKYLWVPLQKRGKNLKPSKVLNTKGVFFIKTKGHYLIVKRKGKSRTLTPLFSSRKSQTIKPVFNFKHITEQRAQRYMNIFFIQKME